MDDQVKGTKLMEMTTSNTLSCLPCEEQETRGSVIYRNESLKLRRASSSSSSSSGTTDSGHDNGQNHHDTNASSGRNSPVDTTLLSRSSSRSKHHFEKQDVELKWKETMVVENGNESATNCCVDDNELPRLSSSAHREHVIGTFSDVKSNCSPNHKAEPELIQMEQTPPECQGHNHAMLVFKRVAKAANKEIRSWVVWKWIFRLLNFGSELIQVVLSSTNCQGNIGNHGYLCFILITSFICLVISLAEFFGEVKAKRAVWERRGWCWWYYYPEPNGRLFGKFPLYFGVVSSTIQFIINSVALRNNKKVVKFDYFPLLLSFAHLIAAVFNRGEECPQPKQDHSTCLISRN